MILEVKKWPPGGTGIVLSLETWSFNQFLMVFHEFWTISRWFLMNFGISCAHTLAPWLNVRSIPGVPVLLTSKPHETLWNISETLKKYRKLSKRATKPLENGFSLNFDQFPWIFRCTKTKNKASVYCTTQIQPKNANIVLNNEKKESQQHPVFPGGHPSKYWLGSMLLNFSDRTRTGVFNMIWPLARKEENFNILFQQHTCIHIHISQFCVEIDWICPFQKKKIWLGLT